MKIAVEKDILSDEHIDRLKKQGNVVFYDEQTFAQAKDADIIVPKFIFDNNLIPELKAKLVSVCFTGYDIIDVDVCKEHDITVTNVPDYSTHSVAELVFAFILGFARKQHDQHLAMEDGLWNTDLSPGLELHDKTIGIVGYGSIGKQAAKIAEGFGMDVLVYNRSKVAKQVSLKELLQKSDFVTLHVPLNDKTKGMIGKKELGLMKSSAYLINAARGPIVNEKALIKALEEDRIAGAGLDVYWQEPLPRDHKLLKMDNVLLTPHTAFYTEEAMQRLGDICVDNVEAFLKGKPQNVVEQ